MIACVLCDQMNLGAANHCFFFFPLLFSS